jgi:hypothetical protein
MCQLIYKLPLHLVHNEICITFSALLGLGQYFHPLLVVDTESAQWQTSSRHLGTLKDIISYYYEYHSYHYWGYKLWSNLWGWGFFLKGYREDQRTIWLIWKKNMCDKGNQGNQPTFIQEWRHLAVKVHFLKKSRINWRIKSRLPYVLNESDGGGVRHNFWRIHHSHRNCDPGDGGGNLSRGENSN